MDGIRRYLDHAATSFPKHPQVIEAMRLFAEGTGASPGRGAYAEAISAGQQLSDCRSRLARLASGPCDGPTAAPLPADHVVFTLNASDALNLAIKGVTAGPIRAGRSVHLITTAMDHNSVLRPFNALAAAWPNVSMTVVDVDAFGVVDLNAMQAALDGAASDDAGKDASLTLLAVSHGSNVTGSVQSIDRIGAMANAAGAIYLVDAAQTFGHRTVDMTACNIDLLAVPGHKGLLGPLGTGALMIKPALVAAMEPLREGGTGSVSEHEFQPDFMPDKFEPGSHNAIGLAGLNASLAWMESRGIASIHAEHRRLIDRFADKSAAARAPRPRHSRSPARSRSMRCLFDGDSRS